MFQEDSSNGIVTGFVLGAVAGIAIGLMLAPKTGRDTRDLVRQGIVDGLEMVRHYREGRSGDGDEPLP